MTHILDYPSSFQSLTADLSLLQGKFVSFLKVLFKLSNYNTSFYLTET